MRAISTKQGIYGMAVMRPEEETKRSVQASVRNARARLTTTRRMRPDYKYEVMRMFARRQLGIAMGLPALATVIAAIMALWIPLQVVAVWLGTVFAGKAIILALARWFSRQAPAASTACWRPSSLASAAGLACSATSSMAAW